MVTVSLVVVMVPGAIGVTSSAGRPDRPASVAVRGTSRVEKSGVPYLVKAVNKGALAPRRGT